MDFPHFNTKTDETADANKRVCLVIEHIQQNDERLEYIEENGTDGKSLQGFSLAPKLNICIRKTSSN